MPDNNTNGGFRVRWSLVVQIIGWVVAALLTYSAINTRVSIIEDRMDTLRTDVKDIKAEQRLMSDQVYEMRSDVKQIVKQKN